MAATATVLFPRGDGNNKLLDKAKSARARTALSAKTSKAKSSQQSPEDVAAEAAKAFNTKAAEAAGAAIPQKASGNMIVAHLKPHEFFMHRFVLPPYLTSIILSIFDNNSYIPALQASWTTHWSRLKLHRC
jgi:hypothetical protein